MNVSKASMTHSAEEILDLVYSIIGKAFDSLEKKISGIGIPYSEKKNIYKIQFPSFTITCIPNIFNIYDICLIEFDSIKDSSAFYNFCDLKFKSEDTHIWFDKDILIQFYTNQAGTRSFRFCLKPLCNKE